MMDDKKTSVETVAPPQVDRGEVEPIHELQSLHVDGLDPVFEGQARLVSHAVQSIGMGRV